MSTKSARELIAEMESLQHELALTRCRCCGKPLNIFVQPSLRPTQQDRSYGTCFNQECERFSITLEVNDLYALTEAQVSEFHTRINS